MAIRKGSRAINLFRMASISLKTCHETFIISVHICRSPASKELFGIIRMVEWLKSKPRISALDGRPKNKFGDPRNNLNFTMLSKNNLQNFAKSEYFHYICFNLSAILPFTFRYFLDVISLAAKGACSLTGLFFIS